MFGLTRGEIVLIAFVFALIYGAGLLPRLSAWISRRVAPGPEADEKKGDSRRGGGTVEGSSRTPTVFVSDASAEAVRISDMLRTAGYSVVDVPLSMLISRASVQKPNVVLIDVDAPGALDEVRKLRQKAGSGSVDFIYIGSGDGR